MQKIEERVKRIQELIAEDQTEEAIRDFSFALEEYELPRKYGKAFVILRNQFARQKKDHVLQIKDAKEVQVERNKTLNQFLEFIEEVVDWVKEHQSGEATQGEDGAGPGDAGLQEPFLVAKSIEKDYGDFKLGPVDVDLRPGKICAVFGPNGSGKSTLLNILAGLVKQSGGTLEYFGKPVSDWYALKMQIGYIPQQIQDKDIDLVDLLKYKCVTHGVSLQELDYYVQDVITKLNLGSIIQKPWSALSGGFKMRFELACTIVWRPPILILDEPLANLDIVTQQHFINDLLNYARSKVKPISILLTSQHIEILENRVDEIIFLNGGQVEFRGAPEQLVDHALVHQIELEIRENGAVKDTVSFLEQQFEKIAIRKFSGRYFVKTPKEVSVQSVLQQILSAGYEVTYFKDVSSSVRKLFSYDHEV